MTPAERIARAERAQSLMDEFLTPAFAELREEYLGRMKVVATTELHPTIRADAITTLSVALKVIETVEGGLSEVIRDGTLARASMAKTDKIEQMTDAQQRLLKITGY